MLRNTHWGTVREDYSPHGTAWEYLPHDHARSKSYRWGEDGIAGLCDNHQRLCFALALWNGRDAIIKERLFGLSGNEGNHTEDVRSATTTSTQRRLIPTSSFSTNTRTRRRFLAIVGRERLRRVLRPLLDESEFLSPYGIRALSKRHQREPFVFSVDGQDYRVD